MMFTAIGGSVTATELPYDFEAASSGGFITDLDHSPLTTSRWYVVTDNGHFFYSTNSGTSWTESSGFTAPGGHYFYGAKILPSKVEPLTVYAAGSGYSNPGVWESTDGGVTFNDIATGLPSTLVYDLDMNEDGSLLFAATEVGPYLYIRSEGQWYSMGTSAPDQVYWEVDFVASSNTARFATYGRGIWDFDIDFFVSQLKPHPSNNPFVLGPNPASDLAGLVWQQPLRRETAVTVLNMNGEVVLRGTVAVGATRASLDVSALAAGVYLVHCAEGSAQQVEKLMIAR
jgi:hypothetical protein